MPDRQGKQLGGENKRNFNHYKNKNKNGYM